LSGAKARNTPEVKKKKKLIKFKKGKKNFFCFFEKSPFVTMKKKLKKMIKYYLYKYNKTLDKG